MKKQIITNIRTNLKFYLRNALLWIILIVFCFYIFTSIMFSLTYMSQAGKFRAIQNIVSTLSTYSMMIMALVGILIVATHIRNRSLKLVFTKPCTIESWFLSIYLTTLLISGILFLIILLIASILFLVWEIPFQPGLIYQLLYTFLQGWIYFSFLIFLGMILHPFLAIYFAIIFNEQTFYFLLLSIKHAIKDATTFAKIFWLTIAEKLANFIYMILPTSPYKEQIEKIEKSWIVETRDFMNLGVFILYTIVICALFYYLSCYLMKKKRLI